MKRLKKMRNYVIVDFSKDKFNTRNNKEALHSYEESKIILENIKYVDELVVEEDWKDKFDFLKNYYEVLDLERIPGISISKIKKELKSE